MTSPECAVFDVWGRSIRQLSSAAEPGARRVGTTEPGACDRAERRMKIGTKLFLYHLIPLIVLMTLFAYLEQRRARTVLSVEVAREGRVLTRTIQIAVQDAVRDRQLEDVHTLVDRISGSGPVMGVRLFDSSGSLTYQSASLQHRPFAESDGLRTLDPSRAAEEVGMDEADALEVLERLEAAGFTRRYEYAVNLSGTPYFRVLSDGARASPT